MSDAFIQKYNVPGPRYTSYPTVPFWKNSSLNQEEWLDTVHLNYKTFGSNEISLYIHLPFCESLCTFCGCHKRITKNHAVETPYINVVIEEWKIYLSRLDFTPVIRELHLGGGTPTFFSPSELKRLISSIVSFAEVHPSEFEFSFEAHPNNTTDEHLEVLFALGFKRLSLGIQDYSPTVQQAIHRIQPFENVSNVHAKAKAIGYTSISHDLVFGLPKQTLEDVKDTVAKTLLLMPDRISLYSYAHVPWVKGVGQRGYDENDLPQDSEKRSLYEVAKSLLEEAGYLEVGMDHFALAHDSLAIAMKNKTLHRNFMGYTTQNTSMMLGLGMSSISDSWFGFTQNEKTVEAYQDRVMKGELPVFRGHVLSQEDLQIRRNILDLMCHFETEVKDEGFLEEVKLGLREMVEDGLVTFIGNKVLITESGIPFVRNVCMAFDRDLKGLEKREGMFSKTV
jgi:oxygen-independent coproporphyrinogen III oxidase